MQSPPTADTAIRQTQEWLEKAVIGLNLCPFAKAVHVRQQIRYTYCDFSSSDALQLRLVDELRLLRDADARQIDTTLLIHPFALQNFLDYNDFLHLADETLAEMELDGIIQIASFHPHYQFADAEEDDITNYTNRSPFPMLHLLRETSVSKAIDANPDTDEIVKRNQDTLRALGHEGWRALWAIK